MYMSRLQLDPANRNTMNALAAPKFFHGAIESGFSNERQRTLWRIDHLQNKVFLLIVSVEKPDLSAAARQFGFPNASPAWETQDYTPFLQRVETNSRWHFRLTANPTTHLPGDAAHGKRGKVVPHVTAKHQERWLMEKAPKHGFTLCEDEFLAVEEHRYRFRKPADENRLVDLLSVTFEGLLTVTDAELFRKTLTEGIGRGKAYGMGMLTVVHAEKQP